MISHIIISMLSRDVRFKKYRYSLVTQRSRPTLSNVDYCLAGKGSGERVHKKTAMGDCRYQIINKLRIKLFHISIDILNVLIIFNFVKEVHNAFDLLVRIRDGVVSEALQVSFDNIYLACFEGIVHCSV